MSETNEDFLKLTDRIQKSMLLLLASQTDDDSDKTWLMERTSNPRLKKLIPRQSVLSLHTLDIISRHKGIKGADIARELEVTKGAISKITRRQLEQELIQKSQLPSNLKEIYFAVTPLGAELAELHRQFHLEHDQKGLELFRSYDLQSLETVADFLEKLARLRDSDGE
ncbi:MarR family transcriptional regulator [Paenibacillus humicola]|uniref:MarR family transcriptional regulator n=1 Tax=Paenibacillus humicola TaxID=3110540 RepID=UPI00237B3E7A|nr:MarR family transcriptional regulator [Paenibacillus humicola]